MSWAWSGGDLKKFFIGYEIAGSDAQDCPAPRQVVEKSHALGDMKRMVIRKIDDRCAQPNPVGTCGRLCECHLGSGHGLPSARVVLTDKEFVEIERVGVLDERDVAVERQRGMLAGLMDRHHKKGEFHGYPFTTILTSLPGTTISLTTSLPSM